MLTGVLEFGKPKPRDNPLVAWTSSRSTAMVVVTEEFISVLPSGAPTYFAFGGEVEAAVCQCHCVNPSTSTRTCFLSIGAPSLRE